MARARLLLLAVLAAAVSGCATVPTSGAARALPGNSGAPEAFVQPLPPPAPQSSWSPEAVVDGFLQASASSLAAARRYLAPGVNWHPPGSVTVLNGNNPSVVQTPDPKLRFNAAQVTVSGQRLASLSETGQYLYRPGAASYNFTLARSSNVWLIESLPQTLLLTQTDFQEVYQPRNLYFFSASNGLVPDPVFAPVQGANAALSTDVAADLVNGLIEDRGSWLSAVTTTDFPARTRLLGISISGQTAVVNLGGTASTASAALREGMYAQLWQTLTSPAYSPPIATSVQLEIDGAVQYLQPVVTGTSGTEDKALYLADGYLVKELPPGGRATTSTKAFPFLGADITAVAISRVGRPELAAAMPGRRGCAVEVGDLDGAGGYNSYTLGSEGPCTSLSWDNSGRLWAVADGRIWVLQPGYSAPVRVSVPSLAAGSRVLALRIAADDVRAAMLVQAPSGTQMVNQLFLAAVRYTAKGISLGSTVPSDSTVPIGTDLADPTAISWYGQYYLVAIDGPEMYQVPLTGGQSQPLEPVPAGAVSISSDGMEFAVATTDGKVWVSPGPEAGWPWSAQGTAVAYPG